MTQQAIKVFNFLRGRKCSAAQITLALYVGDPRSVIRRLRAHGVKVHDEWKRTQDNAGQYKIYWIDPAEPQPEL